jgi:hypothetical protein
MCSAIGTVLPTSNAANVVAQVTLEASVQNSDASYATNPVIYREYRKHHHHHTLAVLEWRIASTDSSTLGCTH